MIYGPDDDRIIAGPIPIWEEDGMMRSMGDENLFGMGLSNRADRDYHDRDPWGAN